MLSFGVFLWLMVVQPGQKRLYDGKWIIMQVRRDGHRQSGGKRTGACADREQDAMNMPADLCMDNARGPSWWRCWYQERNFNIVHEARDSTKWITEIKWCVLRGSGQPTGLLSPG